MPSLIVDPAKCIKCGICTKICPAGIIEFGETGLPEMNKSRAHSCVACGHCVLFCPESANSLPFLKRENLIDVSNIALPSEECALNLLKTRRSIRCFKDRTIQDETLFKIFETVKMAPSACNDQPVRWIISNTREKTAGITNLMLCWLREEIFKDPTAPLSIVAANIIAQARAGRDVLLRGAGQAVIAVVPKEHKWPEDGVIALTYLELAAHSLGVGACWGGFLTMAARNFEGLREYLGIKDDEHICGAQMLGYPELKPSSQFPPRKEADITWLR